MTWNEMRSLEKKLERVQAKCDCNFECPLHDTEISYGELQWAVRALIEANEGTRNLELTLIVARALLAKSEVA